MHIVIPVKSVNKEESIVAPTKEATSYAFLELGEGMQIVAINFFDALPQDFFDYIITPDKNDNLDEAYELGARALLARAGMSIDEIVEALMFRELDEIM
ncbi:hypothetical protein [Nitratiruptor sp. YY09-18]|uniref:hypothetical protein n=1 Tax=Nitratiruptor sp. YY09-18 TaxID=2724901 RepID=UPI001914F5EF|nr:hypothetical protein [Nitratiruptor sp. YY09-18]BCD68728.1 hypothetical protein NitYY0918_C1645 [Nitratiruptor sp. YY09-18]